jgi:hypothetical protein
VKKDYTFIKKTLDNTENIRKKLAFSNQNSDVLRLKLLKI